MRGFARTNGGNAFERQEVLVVVDIAQNQEPAFILWFWEPGKIRFLWKLNFC